MKKKSIYVGICIIFLVLVSVFFPKEKTELDISKYTISDTKPFQQEHYSKQNSQGS